MYITRTRWKSQNGKTYETILLRESYREEGKVKNRTLANLTHCKPEEIAAMELGLKHKDDLTALGSLSEAVELREGASVGAVWAAYQVAKRLGIEKALGRGVAGQLAMWQVQARVLDQGSRLSAVRLAQRHAGGDVLEMKRGFDEDDLYENRKWLAAEQGEIERRLLAERRGRKKPELFLYDVTSSYLEGQQNELAAYGYNRDRKRGKKPIGIGLLCDECGEPVSTEVFTGNTQDVKTLAAQVRKAAERFGCKRVTFVGDRGMIKSAGVEALSRAGFHYITALTKPQIETLLKAGVLQMELFDEELCEVEAEGVRYILRRNPRRVEELAASRADKRASVEAVLREQNTYLREHAKAQEAVALRKVREKIERLGIGRWLRVEGEGRVLSLRVDEAVLSEASRLDGCYVIHTDVPKAVADRQTVHDRYKELTEVERAFRTCKTGHLEIRPVYVRTEESTRGHVLVVMLAYLIVRELQRAWASLDVTVEEGLQQLSTLCSMEIRVKGQASCHKIPQPREISQNLLEALGVRLPEVLPHRNLRVVTKKKLPSRRKTA